MTKLKKLIPVGVCDDHPLFRKAISHLVEAYKDEFLVTIQADNGKKLIQGLSEIDEEELPEIVLLDINMPEMDGFRTTRVLTEKFPSIKIVILTMFNDENTIVKMFKLGIAGYLTKNAETETLIEALRSVRDKGFFHSESITNKLIKGIQNEQLYSVEAVEKNITIDIWNKLNKEEKEFISLSCTDMTYGEIAMRMLLLPKQVEAMRSSLFSKFDVKTRVGLAVLITKALGEIQANESKG